MNPEFSPSELEALRLQRDIDALTERDCKGERAFDDFKSEAPRKTKKKKKSTEQDSDE